MTKRSPYRYFKTSPKIIRLAVMMYVRFPLSLRNVQDVLRERGIGVSYETIRFGGTDLALFFAAEIRQNRSDLLRFYSNWRWRLDEVFVKVNGERHYLLAGCRSRGRSSGSYVTNRWDRSAALKFLKKVMKHYGEPETVDTDKLRSLSASIKVIGNVSKQETDRWKNNPAENSHLPFRRRARAMQRFRRMRSVQKFVSVLASVFNHSYRDRSLSQ